MQRLALISLFFLTIGCAENNSEIAAPEQSSTNEVVYAKLFDIGKDSESLSIVVYTDSLRNTEMFSTQVPLELDSARVAALSTTHTSYLHTIGALDHVVGQAYSSYLRNEQVKKHFEQNNITALSGQADADVELILDLSLDYYFVYPYGNDDYSIFKDSGIECVPICEYLEKHPLARAEWIKLVGALVGKYDIACAEFEKIRTEYEALVKQITEQKEAYSPVVFTGSYDEGKWFAPSANSYIAQFIRDAGGEYLFDDISTFTDNQSGNIELEFELMFEEAQRADWWGKVLYSEEQVLPSDLTASDERLAELKCFQDSNLFYCNTHVSDYFGDGVVEPQRMLSEIAAILHPKIMQSEAPKYFHSLKPAK